MVKTTSNKRALIRFLKVFSLPLVLLFLVFEMLESGKGGLHYSIHHHRHGSSSGGSDNEMASGRGKVGVLRRQKKNNNVAFVRMRDGESEECVSKRLFFFTKSILNFFKPVFHSNLLLENHFV